MGKQLKQYRDSRQQFLSNISHDLRTPLTYIKAYAAVMKESSTVAEKECREYIQVIYQQAIRMEHLVTDLFELTKLDEGKMTLRLEKVCVKPWLASILESRKLIFKQHQITACLLLDDDEAFVIIDKERMTQVIDNLLENSIRYTAGGKISVTVKSDQDEDIQLRIEDNGIGIPAEDLPNIWDRFYRVDKSRSTESGGSGLGLSIVKELVALHHGTISVSSHLGKGTVFTIRLKKEWSNV